MTRISTKFIYRVIALHICALSLQYLSIYTVFVKHYFQSNIRRGHFVIWQDFSTISTLSRDLERLQIKKIFLMRLV